MVHEIHRRQQIEQFSGGILKHSRLAGEKERRRGRLLCSNSMLMKMVAMVMMMVMMMMRGRQGDWIHVAGIWNKIITLALRAE